MFLGYKFKLSQIKSSETNDWTETILPYRHQFERFGISQAFLNIAGANMQLVLETVTSVLLRIEIYIKYSAMAMLQIIIRERIIQEHLHTYEECKVEEAEDIFDENRPTA